jgi:hypoxanthine phosphoribosyltransferase
LAEFGDVWGARRMIVWRSLEDMVRTTMKHIGTVRALKVEAVVGIPRGGMIAASIIAMQLGLPLADAHTFSQCQAWPSETKGIDKSKRALLVDDSAKSGHTLEAARAFIGRTRPEVELVKAAVFAAPQAVPHLDLHFDLCDGSRLFEWELWEKKNLGRFCVDMDGVLCEDPVLDDDGPEYWRFLHSAKPLCRPLHPVGSIVTARLEKYRKPTEDWLHANEIAYGSLHMLPMTAEERKRTKPYVGFKSDLYRRTGAELFIESNSRQVVGIAKAIGKPVLAMDLRQLIQI